MNKKLIAEELEEIRLRHGGVLEAQDVVDEAKRNHSLEIHKHFNWNVEEAANAYWLQQARYLITVCVSVSVEPDDEPKEVRVFFREGKAEAGEERASGYVPTAEVLKDPDGRRKLIITIIRRVLGILNSYPIAELQPIVNLCHKLLRKYSSPGEPVK
jgi:hypothetical protein